jgi:hypothetical protein
MDYEALVNRFKDYLDANSSSSVESFIPVPWYREYYIYSRRGVGLIYIVSVFP